MIPPTAATTTSNNNNGTHGSGGEGVIVHRAPLFEDRRMLPERAAKAFWPALYALWISNWHIVDHGIPRPGLVSLKGWLGVFQKAISAIYSKNVIYPETDVSAAFIAVPLSGWELAHVAGGLIRAGFAASRIHVTSGIVYSIDPMAAIRIQEYLNQHVRDQRMRPGQPCGHDHLQAVQTARGAGPTMKWMGLSMTLVACHEALMTTYLSVSVKKTTATGAENQDNKRKSKDKGKEKTRKVAKSG